MRAVFQRIGAVLLLVVVLAGCGGGGGGARLVTPPANVEATVAVTLPPTPGAPPTETPVPTTVTPSATRAFTATVAANASPTRVPEATATQVRATATIAATATRPPAPTPTRVPATTAPVGKARAVERGPSSRRVVALTFDAGADRGYAARILDTLRDTGVKATFGMTGKWAEQNPDLIQRMVGEGHQLMNHTYDHASFTGRSPGTKALTTEERRRAIERTEAVIFAATGVGLKPYFRPPYGDYDDAMLTQLGQLGYGYSVMWTVDSLGWNGRTADQIVRRCVDGAAPGAILLFHVGAASQDAAALPEIIRQLRAAGYGFATIEELLR